MVKTISYTQTMPNNIFKGGQFQKPNNSTEGDKVSLYGKMKEKFSREDLANLETQIFSSSVSILDKRLNKIEKAVVEKILAKMRESLDKKSLTSEQKEELTREIRNMIIKAI